MTELSSDERAKLGAKLIEQSPPGEVNDVINVLSDAAILPGTSGEGERYVDTTGKQSFAFDHVNVVASDYEAYELPEDEEAFRAELAKSLAAYTKDHYSTGQFSVNCSQYPLLPPTPKSLGPSRAAENLETEEPASDVVMGGSTPAPSAAADPAEVITDIVPEQIGGGASEPSPTPSVAVGVDVAKTEEASRPGGMDKVDKAIEEIKETEDERVSSDQNLPVSETIADGAPKDEVPGVAEPEVGEVGGLAISSDPAGEASAESSGSTEPTTAVEAVERKQERIENPIYTLMVVGNRYKTDAFWTGRWRTCWTVDKAAGKVEGRLLVDVHYFEQGNVQLTTNHKASFAYPTETSGQSVASQIVTTISKVEAAYQMELQDVYGDLGDKVFRSLRRALPVTRQKVDWEKVGGYSLGSDISKSRA